MPPRPYSNAFSIVTPWICKQVDRTAQNANNIGVVTTRKHRSLGNSVMKRPDSTLALGFIAVWIIARWLNRLARPWLRSSYKLRDPTSSNICEGRPRQCQLHLNIVFAYPAVPIANYFAAAFNASKNPEKFNTGMMNSWSRDDIEGRRKQNIDVIKLMQIDRN